MTGRMLILNIEYSVKENVIHCVVDAYSDIARETGESPKAAIENVCVALNHLSKLAFGFEEKIKTDGVTTSLLMKGWGVEIQLAAMELAGKTCIMQFTKEIPA